MQCALLHREPRIILVVPPPYKIPYAIHIRLHSNECDTDAVFYVHIWHAIAICALHIYIYPLSFISTKHDRVMSLGNVTRYTSLLMHT